MDAGDWHRIAARATACAARSWSTSRLDEIGMRSRFMRWRFRKARQIGYFRFAHFMRRYRQSRYRKSDASDLRTFKELISGKPDISVLFSGICAYPQFQNGPIGVGVQHGPKPPPFQRPR
jgi:hypothetical protein